MASTASTKMEPFDTHYASPRKDIVQLLACDKFTLFPTLPCELRNKVWAFVASELQTIIVATYDSFKGRYGIPLAVPNQSRQPALLHICRESRQEGVSYYTKVLDKCCPRGPHACRMRSHCHEEQNILYINFNVDTFGLSVPEPILALRSPSVDILPYVADGWFNFDRGVLRCIQRLYIPTRGGGPPCPRDQDIEVLFWSLKSTCIKECILNASSLLDLRLADEYVASFYCRVVENILRSSVKCYQVEYGASSNGNPTLSGFWNNDETDTSIARNAGTPRKGLYIKRTKTNAAWAGLVEDSEVL